MAWEFRNITEYAKILICLNTCKTDAFPVLTISKCFTHNAKLRLTNVHNAITMCGSVPLTINLFATHKTVPIIGETSIDSSWSKKV